MVFPEFDPSLIGKKGIAVRFDIKDWKSLSRLLYDSGYTWGSGDSLLSWPPKGFTHKVGRQFAIEFEDDMRVYYGSASWYIDRNWSVYDYMPDIQIICPVDDLL